MLQKPIIMIMEIGKCWLLVKQGITTLIKLYDRIVPCNTLNPVLHARLFIYFQILRPQIRVFFLEREEGAIEQ